MSTEMVELKCVFTIKFYKNKQQLILTSKSDARQILVQLLENKLDFDFAQSLPRVKL